MADSDLVSLTALTAPFAADEIYVVHDTGGSAVDRKMQLDVLWGAPQAINNQVANYILAITDIGKMVEMNVAGANTLTVPPNISIPFLIGTRIDIVQQGAGQTTITAGAGVTLRAYPGLKIAAQYCGCSIIQRAANEWYVFGALAA